MLRVFLRLTLCFMLVLCLVPAVSAYTDTVTTMNRQPYLQQGDTASIIIRWRTVKGCTSKVKIGPSAVSLATILLDTNLVTEHILKVTGLSPDTKYYYSVGSTLQTFLGDTTTYFRTAPVNGSTREINIWATGDGGQPGLIQSSVRDKYLAYIGGKLTDIWLLLGDNAYTNGLDAEYQGDFFNIFKNKLLRQTPVWPVPGNHEYANNAALQVSHTIAYFNIFSLPASAEMGGAASGTESWYSFNYGNIHFISLDSYGIDAGSRMSDTLGPQAAWLKNDLAANTQKWTIVYFHHPPYSMGSHNSDTETELADIRQELVPILDRYHVDLVLSGHSHTYERSHFIHGYYGMESAYDSLLYAVSNSSGRYDGTVNSCPYIKNAGTDYRGTVYTVAGTASKLSTSQVSYPHAAMYCSNDSVGASVAVKVKGNRLDLKMIGADGVIYDHFTMFRDVNKNTDTTILAGQSISLSSSWEGTHIWNYPMLSGQNVTVTPDSSVTITVTDSTGCLSDVFSIHVCYPLQVQSSPVNTTVCEGTSMSLPVILNGSDTISCQWESSVDSVTWITIVPGPVFSHVVSDTLVIDSVTIAQNNTWLRLSAVNDCSSLLSPPFLLKVLPNNSPLVTISSHVDSICQGSMQDFYAVSNGCGSTPSYQWYWNGAAAGSDSTWFGSTSFANGDSVFCVVTSSATCSNYLNDTSASIHSHVFPSLSPSVSISPSGTVSLLPGDTVIFNAAAVNGGAAPHYQWYVNGMIAGGDSSVFTGYSLLDGDIVSCSMTSSAFCADNSVVNSDSAVVSVMITTQAGEVSARPGQWKLIPNVSEFQSQLVYRFDSVKDMKIELLNGEGRLIKEMIPSQPALSGSITIPLSGIPAGIYLVKLSTATYCGVEKLMVIK
ncbi:MAG: metallophosphoesterase [Bacteroidia bacterium]